MAVELIRQLLSLFGAGCILLAFAMVQLRRWKPEERRYNVFNLLGGLMLLGSAWIDRNWGFIVLELLWSGLSAWSLMRMLLPTQEAEVGDERMG
jgi:hypothetical protein|nr:MAG: hypothetical protein KatS3mg041_0168 [Bacteroidota bacterium]